VRCGLRCSDPGSGLTRCFCRQVPRRTALAVGSCQIVSPAADGCRHGPDSAVLCRDGAALPAGVGNKSRIVRLGTGSVRSCRTVPGHATECRRVPPDGGICRPVTIRHDWCAAPRGADSTTLSGTRRFQMARPVTSRPKTAHPYLRHSSALSGTIRNCAASHGTDRTDSDAAKSRHRRWRHRIRANANRDRLIMVSYR